jgi:hypothetical protein
MDLAAAGSFLQGIGAVGSLFGGSSGRGQATQNFLWQRRFAKNAVRWRAEDAKRAGLHPLWAMGASVPSFQPTVVGQSDTGSSWSDAFTQAGNALNHFAMAKQNIKESEARIGLLEAQKNEIENSKIASDGQRGAQTFAASKQLAPVFTPLPGRTDKQAWGRGAVPVEEGEKYGGEAGEAEYTIRNYKNRFGYEKGKREAAYQLKLRDQIMKGHFRGRKLRAMRSRLMKHQREYGYWTLEKYYQHYK